MLRCSEPAGAGSAPGGIWLSSDMFFVVVFESEWALSRNGVNWLGEQGRRLGVTSSTHLLVVVV